MATKVYDVCVQEVWNRNFLIEASSADEARAEANRLIESGDSEGVFEYSHTLDTDEWDASNITSQIESLKKQGIDTKIDNKKE